VLRSPLAPEGLSTPLVGRQAVLDWFGYPLSPGHHAPSITCREGLTTLPWQR